MQSISGVSPNVYILDEAFFMPPLNRSRRIWIYLPPSYAGSTGKYPVLYMHDGQNLFDESTSFSGEWGVDDILDQVPNPCIVVGIDNGSELRMKEYNPNDHKVYGQGEGFEYLRFIVNFLKPYIDTHFRTLSAPKNTMMAGSSMGGLISFYAGIYYPEVFGRLGILSPAFWIAPQLIQQMKQWVKPLKNDNQRYYFYSGGLESPKLATDMRKISQQLSKLSSAKIETSFNPGGGHNESSWHLEFPRFYSWITQ